jgi:RNA polymerase sigma factor (sigma-70 family)
MEASAARGQVHRLRPAPLSARLLRLASDERLVEHVRHGSEPAFEAIYDRHHRGILGFCRHMLGDAGEAEDALQHTFMAAYRDLLGSDKAIQLKPWLYTIARNRCLSMLRARRERPSDDIDEVSTLNLAAEVQQRQDLKDLLRDLSELPDDQRAALVLSELGDVSHDEIASVLDCRREKVKALVFQARSSLASARNARDADCSDIREQLATLRGGSLRRTELRRHLKDCEGCRAFAEEVKTQRKMLAVALPVIPTLALKENALAAAFGSGGAGAAATAAGTAAGGAAVATGGSALTAKALVIVALAGGGGGATVAAVSSGDDPATPASQSSGAPQGDLPAAAAGGQDTAERARSGDTPIKRRVRKNKKDGDKQGKAHAKGRDKAKRRDGKGGDNATKEQREAAQAERREAASERRALQRQQRAQRESERRAARPEREPEPDPTPKPAATPRPDPTPRAEPTPRPKPDKGTTGTDGDAAVDQLAP